MLLLNIPMHFWKGVDKLFVAKADGEIAPPSKPVAVGVMNFAREHDKTASTPSLRAPSDRRQTADSGPPHLIKVGDAAPVITYVDGKRKKY